MPIPRTSGRVHVWNQESGDNNRKSVAGSPLPPAPRPMWKRFAAPAAELVQSSVQSRLALLRYSTFSTEFHALSAPPPAAASIWLTFNRAPRATTSAPNSVPFSLLISSNYFSCSFLTIVISYPFSLCPLITLIIHIPFMNQLILMLGTPSKGNRRV